MTELTGALIGWQLGALAAAAVLTVRWWRRRSALNEALHELRRPLQVLALVGVPGRRRDPAFDSSLRLAAAALERLEREVNGGRERTAREPVAAWPLIRAAVDRWRPRAEAAGATLSLRRGPADVVLEGDRIQLAQALDNLILNAIEHGGGSIAVEAAARGGRLVVSVLDSGPGNGGAPPARGRASLRSRLAGRARRGHGLRVVRRVAAAHGGRFGLRRSADGCRAVLELPLRTDGRP